jgi:ketosteroid isomerase-like protein
VVVFGRTTGTPRASGVQADAESGMVFDLREGKLSRLRAFLDHGETMRAADLEE